MSAVANDLYDTWATQALETALHRTPGYADWRRLDPGPSAPVGARYAAMPVLTKQELREHFPLGFIPKGHDLEAGIASGEVEYARTSGSTGDQVVVVFHAPWWEASERSAWQLNTIARRVTTGAHREVVLASPRCVGPGYTGQPQTPAQRTLGRHLYINEKINPATWTDDDVRRMADELNAHEPVVLEADPAYLAAFACRLRGLDIPVHQPALVFLTYSFPSRLYLRSIRAAFTAPVASSYGTTETGHVFLQCEAGRLHQNVEHCRVDLEPFRPFHGGPTLARMLVTVFHNPWFAVLRFDVGDVAHLDGRGPCPCGRREGLTLASIDGRIPDITFTPDGRSVTVDQIDRSLAAIDGIRGWQLDHVAPNEYRLHLLAEPGMGDSAVRASKTALTDIYSTTAGITVAEAAALDHEASGKFRFARTHFPVDHSVLWAPTDVHRQP